LVWSFQNFLEEIFTLNFFSTDVGLKLYFICLLEMVVGRLWKHSTCTLQLLLGALRKQGTCTIKFLLGPLERKVLTH